MSLNTKTDCIQAFRKQVIETLNEKNAGIKDPEHPTVFDELLDSKLSPEEKSVDRLTEEAQVIVVAGAETTAWALVVAVYHLLANPSLLQRLKIELAQAIPDPSIMTPQTTLENLPYLSAVIKECLRLSYGASSRLQRVPHEPLIFPTETKEWVIPAWTPVSMTSVIMHHQESIFPNSKEFNPERWIEDPHLDKYLVSFSKGSRSCLGMNLAYAEMYLWLSGVFRRFGSKEVRFEVDEGILELVNTGIEDVEIWADRLIPLLKPEREGVKICVKP